MNRTEIINGLIADRSLHQYLEIGLDNPDANFTKIVCDNKDSVDPYIQGTHGDGDQGASAETILKHLKFHMTSDEFFEQSRKEYDIIFIDGLHTKEQVMRDIVNSLYHIDMTNGVIVVHDCLPRDEIYQRVPRETSEWNGDVWKAIYSLIQNNGDRLDIDVVDCDYGVGIIGWKNPFGSRKVDSTLIECDYNEVFTNRDTNLNVISTRDFELKYLHIV